MYQLITGVAYPHLSDDGIEEVELLLECHRVQEGSPLPTALRVPLRCDRSAERTHSNLPALQQDTDLASHEDRIPFKQHLTFFAPPAMASMLSKPDQVTPNLCPPIGRLDRTRCL